MQKLVSGCAKRWKLNREDAMEEADKGWLIRIGVSG